ncbi:hypothetical protein AB0L25_18550 [Spirillospora sp. NPDC052242]
MTKMPTAHRRINAWTKAGLRPRLHHAVLNEFSVRGQVDWASTIVDSAVRAKRVGAL